MKFKTIYKIFVYSIVVIAYGIIIYKLATYNEYASLFEHFASNFSTNWLYLLLCLMLMPCNITAESLKWKYAISHIEDISLKKAIISTLRGQVGGIATPNKLGDIPTRALSLKEGNKTSGTIMGFVASWTLSIVIIIVGIISSAIYISEYHINSINHQYLILSTATAIVAIGLIFSIPYIAKRINTDKFNSPKIKTSINALSQISAYQLLSLSALSALRYIIFCSQMLLMLLFFGINITIFQAFMAIPTIYLLSTITPTITASEAATRSSYAILILAPFCTAAPTIALATSLLWALNCGTPIIIGSFLLKFKKSISK